MSSLSPASSCPVALLVALPQELDATLIPNIPVVYTGVGKVNAAIAAAHCIQQYRPCLLLNFGSAGRVRPGPQGLLEIGRVLQRDMLAEPLAPRGTTPFHDGPHALESGLPGLVCATGDSFVTAKDPWLEANRVDVVDMELFAIAAVAHEHSIAWRSFKYVTDDTNEDSGQDWQQKVRHGERLFIDLLQEVL